MKNVMTNVRRGWSHSQIRMTKDESADNCFEQFVQIFDCPIKIGAGFFPLVWMTIGEIQIWVLSQPYAEIFHTQQQSDDNTSFTQNQSTFCARQQLVQPRCKTSWNKMTMADCDQIENFLQTCKLFRVDETFKRT